MSVCYAIRNKEHANNYWNHPILLGKLGECFALVKKFGKAPEQIFSPIDAMKYRGSRSLFREFENLPRD